MKKNIAIPVNPTYHEVINERAKKWEDSRCERYKEYRKKWVENPKNFTMEKAPIHLDIEPTNACNLKCPMCPRTVLMEDVDRKDNFKVGFMDMDTYKKIVDEAANIGVYSIKLNWLGEPLMHKNIADMIRYAKEKGIVDVMLNTNAALLNEKMSRDLIKAGLDKIFFSFDSPYVEKYEEIRIGAKYEDVLANIKSFINIREELGKDSPITRVSMVLMEENKDEYEVFIDLFKDIVDAVSYVEYRDPDPKFEEERAHETSFACSQLWQRMFIAWDGEVVPCCVDSERELIMGNIKENSIVEIWNNKEYVDIRNSHSKGNWYEIDRCKKCDIPRRTQDGTV